MKIKGKKKVETTILNIIRPFGVKTAKLRADFVYNNETGIVSFSLPIFGELEKYHCEWINARYNIDLSDPLIYWFFSLLHEVGHHQTMIDLTDEDLEFEYFMRELIDINYSDQDDNFDSSDAYFSLPAEILATEWALNYMENNEEWVNKNLKLITKTFNHFYNRNRR